MRTPLKARKQMALALLIALFLLLQSATGSSTLAASQTATGKSLSGKTTTVPAGNVLPGATTTTAPLPSTAPARTYQQVEKPPVYHLDIPEYDLAGKLSDVRFKKRNQFNASKDQIHFKISLKNYGKTQVDRQTIPIKIRLINTATNTILEERRVGNKIEEGSIGSQYWVITTPERAVWFRMGESPAPGTLNELKLIVDIDPDNTFHEAQRHRGNNRCVASW